LGRTLLLALACLRPSCRCIEAYNTVKEVMSSMLVVLFVLYITVAGAITGSQRRISVHHQANKDAWGSLLQSGASTNPVVRVVNLLKEMGAKLKKEMDDDQNLYDKLMCWCHDGKYEKEEEIEAAQSKIASLESSIESLTAKSSELTSSIASIKAKVAEDKSTLAEATKIREEEASKFHESEKDSIEALENLKAAMVVLSKHEGAAFPQTAPLSFIAEGSRDIPWAAGHESRVERSFDDFVRQNDIEGSAARLEDTIQKSDMEGSSQQFLQQKSVAPTVTTGGWSAHETFVVQRALKVATVFAQRHEQSYYPSYTSQSGEIIGILKTLQEQMKGDLSEAQQTEAAKAAAFHEMREAKMAEIEAGEAMEERKEDELATTKNDLANAKEDLKKTEDTLSEDQKFLMTMTATCKDATANFDARKASRLSEIKAVSETIGILTSDEAKDNFKATYSFVQKSAARQQRRTLQRQRAATVLRRAAVMSKMPELSMLATNVELDAFEKVKKAIDGMLVMLKTQQEDEVKKNDYCKKEIQSNEMDTAKANSLKSAQEAKIEELESTIVSITEEIKTAKAEIATAQLELQSATEDRVAESKEFQTTIAEQRLTQGILKAALERLSTFYDSESFAQTGNQQTPPGPPQMEYKASEASTGVMQMIEKIIFDAKELEKETQEAEAKAVSDYESLVADTNDSVSSLQKQVVMKTKEKAETKKDKTATEEDLDANEAEIAGLIKYNGDLHGDCDYLLKNFDVRQEARTQEMDALNQAKAILSGANAAL